MSSEDDGHGPKYGCGWQACGNLDAEVPCPFVKDDFVSAPVDTLQSLSDEAKAALLLTKTGRECKHEWRARDQELFKDRDTRKVIGSRWNYYCIHCLEIIQK